MSARIDHVAAAKEWIENSVKAQASTQPNSEQLATAYAAVAQVHATLALVEQQRIANLIALGMYTNADGSRPAQYAVARPTSEYDVTLNSEIREGLGL